MADQAYISTAVVPCLEAIEGKILPGIAAIKGQSSRRDIRNTKGDFV